MALISGYSGPFIQRLVNGGFQTVVRVLSGDPFRLPPLNLHLTPFFPQVYLFLTSCFPLFTTASPGISSHGLETTVYRSLVYKITAKGGQPKSKNVKKSTKSAKNLFDTFRHFSRRTKKRQKSSKSVKTVIRQFSRSAPVFTLTAVIVL